MRGTLWTRCVDCLLDMWPGEPSVYPPPGADCPSAVAAGPGPYQQERRGGRVWRERGVLERGNKGPRSAAEERGGLCAPRGRLQEGFGSENN